MLTNTHAHPRPLLSLVRFVDVRNVGARFIAPSVRADNDDLMPQSGSSQSGAPQSGAMNRAPTLGDVVRGSKARVTVAINRVRNTSGAREGRNP